MNLSTRKARAPIAVAGAAAIASGGLLATSAAADVTLGLSPSATTATIVTNSVALPDLSYGLKLTGLTGVAVNTPLNLEVISGTGTGVELEDVAANGAPTGGTPVATGDVSADITTYTDATNLYLSSSSAGTYSLRFFKDNNNSGAYEANIDNAAPTMTLVVKAPADAFNLEAPGTVDAGATNVKATATTSLTTSDIRGTSGGVPVLASEIGSALNFDFTAAGGATGQNTDGAPTAITGSGFDTFSRPLTAAGTVGGVGGTISTELELPAGAAISPVRTTTVTTNNVSALAVVPAAGQKDDVVFDAGNDYLVRAGYDQVKFEAQATVSSGSKAGKRVTVVFTETPITALKVNGATLSPDVPGGNEATVTMSTNADGMAAFTVDSSLTADGQSYDVDATSGTASDGIDVLYEGPVVDSLTTSGNVAATIGGTTNLTGQVLDQWGVGFIPPGSPQATLAIDKTSTSFSVADESHSVDITAAGKFSYTYSDAGNNTARSDTYRWTVGGVSDSGQIRWVSSSIPSSAEFTGLEGNGAFPVPEAFDAPISDHDTAVLQTLTGRVLESGTTALPFGEFSLSGTEGVYFINSAGKAVTTLAAKATETGFISIDGSTSGVEVLFTKAGDDTEIMLKVGTTTVSTGKFTVDQPTEDWKVTVNELTVAPGENGTISGRVEDAFGNGVPGVNVDLTLEGDFGVITSNTSPLTNSEGRFSALFASGSTDSGIVKVVAEINGGTPVTVPAGTLTDTVPAPDLETGIAYQGGVNRAEQNISVKPINPVTVVSPASRVGPGSVEISGKANPGSPVDIYIKRTGTTDDFRVLQTVAVDAEGEWGAEFNVVRSATLYAQQGTVQSAQKTITVFSSVTLNTKVLGGGKVELRGDGNPNQATNMSFYTFDGGKLRKIETKTTTASGFASHIATLSKGAHTIRAYYVATGTRSAFAQKTVTVK